MKKRRLSRIIIAAVLGIFVLNSAYATPEGELVTTVGNEGQNNTNENNETENGSSQVNDQTTGNDTQLDGQTVDNDSQGDDSSEEENNQISVSKLRRGDVNLDGVTNISDLGAIARFIAQIDIITDLTALENADVNDDGVIDIKDLTALSRHVAQIEMFEEVSEHTELYPLTPVATITPEEESVPAPDPAPVIEIDPDATPAPVVTPSATEKLIAVAKAEIGYQEKASKEDLYDFTANAGSANYTKYADCFDSEYSNCYNGRKNGFGWCDVFVDWCFLQTFGYENFLQLTCQPESSCGAACTYSIRYYQAKNQYFTSDPQAGDQIFVTLDDGTKQTGIVEKVDDTYIYTIEGDRDNQVCECKYSLDDSRILGFGRPDYDIVKVDTTVDDTTGDDTGSETGDNEDSDVSDDTSLCTADMILAVAESQIGYKEKASNSNLYSFTDNAGNKNFTKYAYEIDTLYPTFYNGKKNGYAWCDVFVDWCFIQAFGYENALRLTGQPEKSLGAGCLYSMNYYKNMDRWYTSDPQPGDQIIFRSSDYPASHTGIVEKADSTYVYTIEGNCSDQVKRCKYKLTDSKIVGYGRPDYD